MVYPDSTILETEMDTFEEELVSHYLALRKYALKLTKSSTQAEDLVQDTFVRALTKREQFTLGTNLPGWLRTLMHNLFITGIRRREHQKTDTVEDIEVYHSGSMPPSQEDALALKEVFAFIQLLPLPMQDVILRIAVEGDAYEEFADLTEISSGTVKSRLFRARMKLLEYSDGIPKKKRGRQRKPNPEGES